MQHFSAGWPTFVFAFVVSVIGSLMLLTSDNDDALGEAA